MKVITGEGLPKRIKKEFAYRFSLGESGLYLIEITASAKSWRQNLIRFVSFFKDDDLALKIDGRAFPKLDGRRGLFDGEAAWNGNNLNGLSKTNTFFIHLEKGEHELYFFADQGPILEQITIQHIQDNEHKNLSYIPSNNPAQDGNRRQWLSLVFVDLPLESLRIEAQAQDGKSFLFFKKDDSDLKLVIDGEIQKNEEPKTHSYWYWCGRTLKGNKKIFSKELNLPKGLHYIELWADRTPWVEEIKFVVGDSDDNVQRQRAKVVWQHTVIRERPDQSSKILIDKINKNSTVTILEKAIKGERPMNEENNEAYLSDRWHFVEYQNTAGYIFSMALEIEGEDESTIRSLIAQKSKELGEDECAMLAIAKRESRFFPYMVSSVDAQGVFQLMEDAVLHVNEEFGKHYSDRFDIHQNVAAGILYFQIVKEKYKGKDNFWERCLAAWNRGWGYVPEDEPFLMKAQPIATQQFIQDVFTYWGDCKNKLKNSGKILLYLLLAISIGALIISTQLFIKKPYPIPASYTDADYVVLSEEKIDIDKDGEDEKIVAISNIPTEFTFGFTRILLIEKDGSFLELPGYGWKLQWLRVGDFNKNGKTDVAVLYGYSGSAGFGTFYLHEWSDSKFIVLLRREEIGAEADFKDLNGDGMDEILFSFRPLKWSNEQQDVYQWDQEGSLYIKVN